MLESPGGLTFCFVHHRSSERPPPATWPGGHSSQVDQVCLDIPSSIHERECEFWSEVTGLRRHDRIRSDEFSRLVGGGPMAVKLLLQRLDDPDGPVRAHLDLATTDRAAETARHEELGATVLQAFDRGWTVLAAPAGPAYCITDRRPDLAPSGRRNRIGRTPARPASVDRLSCALAYPCGSRSGPPSAPARAPSRTARPPGRSPPAARPAASPRFPPA